MIESPVRTHVVVWMSNSLARSLALDLYKNDWLVSYCSCKRSRDYTRTTVKYED